MASMPDPVGPHDDSSSYAPGIQLTLTLKGQLVQTYSFDSKDVVVGRDPYCAVYVDNPGVSREHFKISRADTGEFRVVDLGSSNGTYLNDKPVKVATLRDGDVIQFSKYSMKVRIDELVGDRSSIRKPSAADGATVMLTPSEVRQMVADAKNKPAGAGPALVKPIATPTPRASSPSPSLDSSRNGVAVIAWLLGAAVVGGAAAVWIFAHR